jgi:hypothetical protein
MGLELNKRLYTLQKLDDKNRYNFKNAEIANMNMSTSLALNVGSGTTHPNQVGPRYGTSGGAMQLKFESLEGLPNDVHQTF